MVTRSNTSLWERPSGRDYSKPESRSEDRSSLVHGSAYHKDCVLHIPAHREHLIRPTVNSESGLNVNTFAGSPDSVFTFRIHCSRWTGLFRNALFFFYAVKIQGRNRMR